jgi:hypothetical protein
MGRSRRFSLALSLTEASLPPPGLVPTLIAVVLKPNSDSFITAFDMLLDTAKQPLLG